ncbi:MAG: DHH family phosphoesterase [Halobacteriaceae archaeon]
MEDYLIDDSALSLERKSLLPGEGFFYPDEIQEEQKDEEIEQTIAGADRVVVADSDADGLACVAIIREVIGSAALIPTSPRDLSKDIRRAAEYSDPTTDIYICDLCPDSLDDILPHLDKILESGQTIHWFDHHQWDDTHKYELRDLGINLVIGDSEKECTADVTIRAIEERVPDYLVELAEVTRDHDLWLKNDERSDNLADYANWVENEEAYVEVVQQHGVDLPDEVMAFLEERREEKEQLIQQAVKRATVREIGDWSIGITYGRCSQNEVAEALRTEGADAAVIIKPAGSASIRGSDDFEQCHIVAQQVNGGGHPKAAGCKPDVYDDMLDYAHHWVTQGAVAKREILNAFRELE